MRLVDDATVRRLLTVERAVAAVEGAFRRFARGQAAVQMRVRTGAGAVKLSTMGAIDLGEGIAGAKVYTTIQGRFRFVVLLFSAQTGEPLAALESDGMTEVRTAAVTALAARHLARPGPQALAVFGTGVQARSHVRALAQLALLAEVRMVGRTSAPAVAAGLAAQTGLAVTAVPDAAAALAGAGIVVTATRSATPLFAAPLLAPGTFLAAVGSTLPTTAELGPDVFARAARIVVEWRPQAEAEAGELRAAIAAGVAPADRIVELGAVLEGLSPGRQGADDIIVYESVGIGLEDIAVAAAVWRALGFG